MCQTDESCTFQNGSAQSKHALLSEGKVELVLNEGSDLENVLGSGSEENIVDSGEEFVTVDLEEDLSDSDNHNIFIFITGICATSRIKLLLFLLCLDLSLIHI